MSYIIHMINLGEMYILEKRLTGGVWGETLELWDFPFDCQDLSGFVFVILNL